MCYVGDFIDFEVVVVWVLVFDFFYLFVDIVGKFNRLEFSFVEEFNDFSFRYIW